MSVMSALLLKIVQERKWQSKTRWDESQGPGDSYTEHYWEVGGTLEMDVFV